MLKYGRLSVISLYKSGKHSGLNHMLCLCECGNKKIVLMGHLKSGHTKSCGCLQKELLSKRALKHGETKKTPEYRLWAAIKQRCTNEKHPDYVYYGARGIKVNKLWEKSYRNFISGIEKEIGRRPGKEYSLDRINTNGNYEPGNVRWATQKQQVRNTNQNKVLEYKNKKMCVSEWSELLNINYRTLLDRLNSGWSIEKALTCPVRPIKRKHI